MDKIKINIEVRFFKEGKFWIAYNSKFEISGYGITKKEAEKSFIITLKEILYHSSFKKETLIYP